MLAHHDALNSESSGTPNGALTAALDFMAASAMQPLADDDAPATARTGQRIGEWKIVRPLGSGGMGEVFEARRADGSFEGRAANKLLKRGMDSAAVLQRLAQERQALARLNHPHIARLFDAGATDEGPPYFMMECVEGVPIDEAAQGRPLEARIALFLQLTDAVAYAHRSLLEHRDLKPGNVLATPEAQVKLLDFGIAKALDPLDGTDADTTVGTARPFRSNYASPERVRGEPVTTATDFYSLGVLLYQLLTDVRPTGRLATTPAEAARSVLEDVPARPSSLPADLVADPHWLATRKRLEGDLDNLLMRALEKPVESRYASVDALAAAVSGAAAAVLTLAASLGVAAWQGHEASVARDEAQRRLADIRSITRDLVFRFGDAVSYLPGGMKVEEDMLQDVLRSLDRLASSPDRDPALLPTWPPPTRASPSCKATTRRSRSASPRPHASTPTRPSPLQPTCCPGVAMTGNQRSGRHAPMAPAHRCCAGRTSPAKASPSSTSALPYWPGPTSRTPMIWAALACPRSAPPC